MRGLHRIVLGLGVMAAAGCGGDGEEPSSETPRTQATATPAKERSPREEAELEIRKAANAYLEAFAAKDWAGVCETLVPSEQQYFDRRGGGSCERVFRQQGADAEARKVLRNSLAGDIRVKSGQATIDITESGFRDVYMKLYALEEDGGWGIARSPKRRRETGS